MSALCNFVLAFLCFEFNSSFVIETQIPRPETVLVPVPFDKFQNIQWANDLDFMDSTCGVFKAYKGPTENIAGRWYTIYISDSPKESHYCSHFMNVQRPCGCMGIDFTINLEHGITSFVMFSTNSEDKSATYGFATASLIGNFQLNMNEIVLRSISVQSNKKIIGIGGYIIPNGVVIDTDNFHSYMVLLFCKEDGTKPIVSVLVKTLPISNDIKIKVSNRLSKDLKNNLLPVDHSTCQYAPDVV